MSKINVIMLSCSSLKGLSSRMKVTGVNVYEEKLISYLSNHKNIEIHLIEVGNENKTFRRDNLIIHQIKDKESFFSKILYLPLLLWEIRLKIRDINPDIVHIFATGCIYGILPAFSHGKYASLITAYGIIAKEVKYYREDYEKDFKKFYAHQFFSFFRKAYERYILSKIPNIVVDTESIKNLVTPWTQSKIYVVPAGVEYDKVKKIGNTSINEIPDIFFVNNLQKIKGADVLIKSILEVKESFPDISVYIAGRGPQENELKNLVNELNLKKNVKFLGFISNKEKYQYYKACKIVIIPSRWDCQPAAFFDAAASGKPVIASETSNPGVLLDGETGFVFKSENIIELSNKIIKLMENEELAIRMGQKAEKEIKKYGWAEVATEYLKIYKEILNNFDNH